MNKSLSERTSSWT